MTELRWSVPCQDRFRDLVHATQMEYLGYHHSLYETSNDFLSGRATNCNGADIGAHVEPAFLPR